MADDNEFFDILYQQWSKTTGAEHTYWMPVPIEDVEGQDSGNYFWDITSVGAQDDPNSGNYDRQFIGSVKSEEDAEFIAGLHGALPDLIRRLHEAIDEAESKDAARDRAEAVSAELAMENIALREQVRELERQLEARQ